jgi:hypothetical protein
MLGLLEVLQRNAQGGVLVLDDIDTLWDDPKSIDLLKAALDSSDPRYISHTVSPRSGSISRFRLNCGVIFLSNRDFNEPKQFRLDIEPIKNRSILCGLSFQPLDLYEYTGWLCTAGGMLRGLSVHENGRDHYLSLRQAKEVLEHFAEHAARYRQISPRTLAKFATMRIGVSHTLWLDKLAEQMSDKAIRRFPSALPVYTELPSSETLAEKELPPDEPDPAVLIHKWRRRAERAEARVAELTRQQNRQGTEPVVAQPRPRPAELDAATLTKLEPLLRNVFTPQLGSAEVLNNLRVWHKLAPGWTPDEVIGYRRRVGP